MRLLIVNADDFGLSGGVNEGVLHAHRDGIVTSASLMVLAPAAAEAAEAARSHPELSIGLHFVEPADVDLNDPDQARQAFTAQLDRFRELVGGDPSHVDSHHHVHATAPRMPIFAELVAPMGVPLRRTGQVSYIGGFWAQWEPGVTRLENLGREHLRHLIDTEVGEGFTELACHPAHVTGDFSSSYLHEREAELATLTEPGLAEEIEASGVTLVSFRVWPEGPSK